MFQKILISVTGCLLMVSTLMGQKTWSLEQCIQHVQRGNTTSMRSANLEMEKAKMIQRMEEANRQPDLSGSSNLGLNLGKTVDPSTNVFANQAIGYNSLALETNYTIYDGNRSRNAIQKSKFEVQALEADVRQLSRNLSLEVLRAYLRILMAEEQLANGKKNLEQSKQWYTQVDRKVKAQILPRSDLRSVEVQISKDEQKVIERQNDLDRSHVELKKILELDPSKPIKIKRPPEIPTPGNELEKMDFTKIYNKALSNQPGIESGELRLKSLEMQEKIARATKMPTISVFGGVWSNFSTANQDFSRPDSTNAFLAKDQWNVFFLNQGVSETIESTSIDGIDYPITSYVKQLSNNLGYGLGVQVRVPILDRKQSHLSAEMVKLDMRQVEEGNIRIKQNLRADIQTAINDVRSAADKLVATEKTYSLLETNIKTIKRKLDIGNISLFEYTTLLNERDQAEIELVIAKYEFLFTKMIVDFYEGKKLKL